MKRIIILFCALLALNAVAQTTIKMKTSKDIGESFTITVNEGLECNIDWGDGKTDTIISTLDPITGTLTGKNVTIKASGLTYFDCSGQEISQITFTAAAKLETLILSNNRLITLSLANLTGLKTLWCDHNLMPSIDISKSPGIESFMAGNNALSKITMPAEGLVQLSDFWVNSNRLTTLDLSACKYIQTLNVEKNQLVQMYLATLYSKATAVFIDGNSLDFKSLWNKINSAKWYGTTQTVEFAKDRYNLNEEFTLDRTLTGYNQDRQELSATTFTYTWYPMANGVRGNKLVRGAAGTSDCDYTTPNTSTQKHLFTFKRAYDDLQLEVKCNKYINFALLSNLISIDDPTAVNNATTADQTLSWTIGEGAITLQATEPTDVTIYNTAGAICWSGQVQQPMRIPLAKGIYIINNHKISI